MYQSRSVKLPRSMYSDRRAMTVDYTYHGDLAISVHEDRSKNEFLFAHGNEVTVVASMLGYLARNGFSKEDVDSVVLESGKEILGEYKEQKHNLTPINSHNIRHIASGKLFGRFNKLQMGWDALCIPIPKQPGILDEVGGTGIYTRDDVFGNKSLLFANIPSRIYSHFNKEDSDNITSELYESDIPVAMKLLCEAAMGDYRIEVGWLLNNYVYEENIS